MRRLFLVAGCLVLAALPVLGQSDGKEEFPFEIVFDPKTDLKQFDEAGQLKLSVSFKVKWIPGRVGEPGVVYKVLIYEEPDKENKLQAEYTVPTVSEDVSLAVVLAMDTSGSMAKLTKTKIGPMPRMDQVKKAAGVFFEKLPAKADTGLVLFNDKIYDLKPPPTVRPTLLNMVNQAKPAGGTAYIDAAYKAVDMVKDFPNTDKVVVVMTDGVDSNSKRKQKEVVDLARKFGVKVHTIGIGKPLPPPITTMLVLDKSGSMNLRANANSTTTKIDDLRKAAKGFVTTMGANRRCAILEFGDAPGNPTEFKEDSNWLQNHIDQIKAAGETCLFDALYEGIITLEAEGSQGKRAVVALTDGIDNKSRRRMDEVIDAAKKAGIPLYLLGFGQAGELDIATMEKMAKDTKGEFHHADNRDKLVKVFDDLSNKIYDVGIESLAKLSEETNGKYYPAEDVEGLHLVVESVVKSFGDEKITRTFSSVRQLRDGLSRTVELKRKGKEGEKAGTRARENVRGVVIAQMDHFVYLIFLALIGTLIALPSLMKRKPVA